METECVWLEAKREGSCVIWESWWYWQKLSPSWSCGWGGHGLEVQEEEEGGRREEANCESGEMEEDYEVGEDVELWECKKVS